jgi:diaminohydroxyphosphoribosylaminopyrimidine deaminase/5-amino-6-(5-phosphoribosylamino)uracil reductase
VTPDDDSRFMALALTLGARGQGAVWPNPAVGCVIVQGSRIVGRGWTQPGGRPHAEAMALAQAGDGARGATAYVTLEPCAHHSPRGPACADLLAAAALARVVTAMTDPDPRTAGQGHARLAAAGIAVTTGVMELQARAAHRGFTLRLSQGRPAVTLKLALSLDGRIATASGESRWITGPDARRAVHLLRARHDAVLIGGGTARADDPALTVRDLGPLPQPVRVVATARPDMPRDSALARSAAAHPLWILTASDADPGFWPETGARLIPVPLVQGRLDPRGMLTALGAQGLNTVLCEGGGVLGASLLAADLVDQIIVFTAGLMLGADARAAPAALNLAALADAPRFRLTESAPVGPDLMHRWTRA